MIQEFATAKETAYMHHARAIRARMDSRRARRVFQLVDAGFTLGQAALVIVLETMAAICEAETNPRSSET